MLLCQRLPALHRQKILGFTKSILDSRESLRMSRAASIPLSDGSPMSSTIKSGCSSSAFSTALNPSMTLSTIWNSGLFSSVEQMNRRKGSESSTTRTTDGRGFQGATSNERLNPTPSVFQNRMLFISSLRTRTDSSKVLAGELIA